MSNLKGKVNTFTLLFVVLLLTFSQLNADDRASGYAIYGPITINTMVNNYSAYRLSAVPQIPNPSIIELPKGGHGFSWYRVEGEINGIWEPVLVGTVGYQVGSGITKTSEIGRVEYPNADEVYWTDPGIVAIKVSSIEIGSGNVGDTAIVSVTNVNGEALVSPVSINYSITNIDRSVEWYYQYKLRFGAGVTAGVATIGANAEIGNGATLRVNLSDTSLADWDSLTIIRKADLVAGVEAKLGPPKLLGVSLGGGASLEKGFSYGDEYTFTKQELENGEALYCGYLFLEPFIGLAAASARSVRFTQSLGEAILLYSSLYGYNLANNRIADESEGTIKAGLDFSAGVAFPQGVLPKNLTLTLGGNLGYEAFGGWKFKHLANGDEIRSSFVGGKVDRNFGWGLKEVMPVKRGPKFDRKWNILSCDFDKEFGYEFQRRTSNGINTYRFENSLNIDNSVNLFDLEYAPTNLKATTWLDISNPQLIGIMNNSSPLPGIVSNIGINPGSLNINNTTYANAISTILDDVKSLHDQNVNVVTQYGSDLISEKDFTLDVDVPFPIVPTPIFINIGGGVSFGHRVKAPLQTGYWYRGLPYLSFQGQNYDHTGVQFEQVFDYLWDNVRGGTNWGVFGPVLAYTFLKNTLLDPWLRFDGDYTVSLSDQGSYLALKNTSLPDTLTEAYCEHWTWQDEPQNPALSLEAKQELTRFNRELRQYREGLAGMRYGIGGFYGLTPESVVFADSASISISYTDAEITGLDEASLAVYWEDNEGIWHYLPSTVYADSNRVEAFITEFRTYTLAPRLPQGSLNLIIQPDSLAADGTSLAFITASGLCNNDGTSVPEGSLYTVTNSRGTIITPDADVDKIGHQISVTGGAIEFLLQSDTIAMPIIVGVSSDIGYASGQISIPLYNVNPPQTPVLLSLEPEHRAIKVTWQIVDETSIAGYKIYYNANTSGAPYVGTSNVNGDNSPVAVGVTDSYIITGLNNSDNYYITVTAVDVSGSESPYSNEMQAQPVLRAVQSLNIEPVTAGMQLTWQPSFGAENYKIYRADSPNAPIGEMTLVGQTSSLFWTDTSVQTNYRGFYVVVAVGY